LNHFIFFSSEQYVTIHIHIHREKQRLGVNGKKINKRNKQSHNNNDLLSGTVKIHSQGFTHIDGLSN